MRPPGCFIRSPVTGAAGVAPAQADRVIGWEGEAPERGDERRDLHAGDHVDHRRSEVARVLRIDRARPRIHDLPLPGMKIVFASNLTGQERIAGGVGAVILAVERVLHRAVAAPGVRRRGVLLVAVRRVREVREHDRGIRLPILVRRVIRDAVEQADVGLSAGGVPSIGTTLPTAVQTNITSLGTVTTGTIAIAGTISTTNTTASTSTGTGALTVTGGAGIGGALYSGTDHTAQVVGTSATPTIAYGVGAGTGAATVALIGNQMAFYLQFNTGTGPTTGVIFTITVPTATGAFGAPPILVPQSTSAVTQTGRISIALTSTTTWTATAVVALSASTNYAYYIVCPASF